MKLPLLQISLALLAAASSVSADDFTLQLLDPQTYPTAKCLDGSMPGYYIRRGTVNSARIHIQGGGWCFSESDCLARSLTMLGSSKNWSVHPTTTDLGPDWNLGCYGLLSNSSANPFANWTAIFIRYCDGSSYSSARQAPVEVHGTQIWFRGFANLQAVVQDLMPVLQNADTVILGGTSAGGLAVYMHADWFRLQLPNVRRFVATPDAGMFLDAQSVDGDYRARAAMQSGLATWFDSPAAVGGTNAACLETFATEAWRCWFAQYLLLNITTPTLVINSLYDPANYGITLGLRCGSDLRTCSPSDLVIAQAYRDLFQNTLAPLVAGAGRGAYATACNQHEETCRDLDFSGIRLRNGALLMADAVAAFVSNPYAQGQVTFDVRWPDNDSCWVGGDHGAC